MSAQERVAAGERSCRGVDPEVFFGPADSAVGGPVYRWERRALAVCADCPVVVGCRAEALESRASEQYGVVGGMTAGQRRSVLGLARRRGSRSSLPGVVELAGQLPREVDGLIVAGLMAGGPVAGASRAEVAHAAVALHRAGRQPWWIAARLGVHDRQVYRWLQRHRAGESLTPPPGKRRRDARSIGAAA